MDRPTRYRICVRGELDERWAARLGDMTITSECGEGDRTVTTLEGRLRDQAELFGVLNTLYELHLPVLSVECVLDAKD